jgi:hypothetical protein
MQNQNIRGPRFAGLTLELMAAVIVEEYHGDDRLKNRPAEVVAGAPGVATALRCPERAQREL